MLPVSLDLYYKYVYTYDTGIVFLVFCLQYFRLRIHMVSIYPQQPRLLQ
jgi:hypothetical protein